MGTSQADNPETLFAEIKETATNKAEVLVMVSNGLIGEDYQWGEEGYGYEVGWPNYETSDPNDHDCSGHIYTCYRKASKLCVEMGFGPIRWKTGASWPRLTANGYTKNSVCLGRDINKAQAGDTVGFRNSSGVIKHITLVAGLDENGNRLSNEARGEKWGVVQYKLEDVLKRSRSAYIYRFNWLDLGDVGIPPVVDKPLLTFGANNDDVIYMKSLLEKHLGECLKGTKYYGPLTSEMVEYFQWYKDLEVDNVVGPNTWRALEATPVFLLLKKGEDDDKAVGLLKWRLQRFELAENLGIYNTVFGPKTELAVKDFQDMKNLVRDGIVGENTWKEVTK